MRRTTRNQNRISLKAGNNITNTHGYKLLTVGFEQVVSGLNLIICDLSSYQYLQGCAQLQEMSRIIWV